MFCSRTVVDFLEGVDIAKVQRAEKFSKFSIDESNIWALILKRELPQFVVSEELLNGTHHRPLVLKCYGILRRAVLANTCIVEVISERALYRLEASLRSATRIVHSHIAEGGQAAYMLVGRFEFAYEGMSSSFPFGVAQYPSLLGLRAGEMEMKLCLKGKELTIGAKYHELGARSVDTDTARTLNFTANVTSVNSAIALSFKEAPLILDGFLRRMEHGMCDVPRNHRSQDQSVMSALCVITIRDGSPRPLTNQIAVTLNMELVVDRSFDSALPSGMQH
eukprot:TRINITY_DN56308_c0_g1_i1.p1 TRINITY_DN56308_c0_g1~~TRINITY_DN56308_c0_g1_i1.p1  ORF type:complete len:278 (+),score=15.86 TRINITY_DN56308_c0_g1_i1:83-916(+)